MATKITISRCDNKDHTFTFKPKRTNLKVNIPDEYKQYSPKLRPNSIAGYAVNIMAIVMCQMMGKGVVAGLSLVYTALGIPFPVSNHRG